MNLLGHWEGNFQSFGLVWSAGPSKKESMWPEEVSAEKQFFFRKRHLLIIVIELWAEKFGLSKKNCKVVKVIFYVSRRTSSEENFALMSSYFHTCFRTLGEKLSELWLSFARQGRQNRNIFSQRNVVRSTFVFEKNRYISICFWTLTESFLDPWRRSLSGLAKLHFQCPDELFGEQISMPKNSFCSDFGRNIFETLKNFFGRVVKITMYVSTGTFWGIT